MRENYLTVIPIAGKGIRALGLTGYSAILKPFINAGERASTVLEEIVKEFTDSGLFELAIIVSGKRDEDTLKRFFRPFETDPTLEEELKARGRDDDISAIKRLASIDISFFEQTIPKGFGDAVANVYPKIMYNMDKGIPYQGVVVVLGDDIIYSPSPCCKQLISVHKQTGSMIVGVQEVSYEEAKKFGVILIDAKKGRLDISTGFDGKAVYEVIGIEEKPKDPKPNVIEGRSRYFAILGRYVLNSSDVAFLSRQNSVYYNNELDFTTLFKKNIEDRRLIAVEIKGEWHTVGSALAAQKTAIKYGLSQYGKEGVIGDEGKQLALYTIRVMKESGILIETEPNLFRVCEELGS